MEKTDRSLARPLAVLALVLLGAPASSPAPAVPKEFEAYRQWSRLLKEPKPVPIEQWVRCVVTTEAEWRLAATKHGPHTKRTIQVYANASAVVVAHGTDRAFPTGSVLVKEKVAWEKDRAPVGVAIMVKRDTEPFKDSGGWEFLYFPNPKSEVAQEGCAGCHRSVSERGFVFGEYPSWK